MLNVAIVGAGGISTAHIEAYLEFPERCRIAAVADPMLDRAEAQKKKFGLDCRTVADPLGFAADPGIDLVSICTPPATHSPLALAFLEAGKHVLLEKPMAASLEECDAMREEAARSGKILSVVAQNRYRTPLWRLKKVLDSGLIGAIRHIQVDSFWWRARSYYDLDWRGTWASEGGGCTLNHSVHHVDLMLWLAGMPHEVVAMLDNVAHDNSEVEDIAMALFRFKPHAVGQLTSSVVHYGEEQAIVVQGEKAAVAWPWKVMSYKARENGFPDGDNLELIEELNAFHDGVPELKHERHAGQIDDILSAIEQGRQPLLTGESGQNAVNVILGIYKSAFEKRPVQLPLEKGDPYYTRDGFLSHVVKFHEKKTSVARFDDGIIVGSANRNLR